MAGLAAKLRRIHVGCAAIAGDGHDKEINDCGHQDDIESMAEHSVIEVDLGKFGRNLAGLLQVLRRRKTPTGNEYEPADEQCRQEQEEDDAEVGVVVGAAEHSTSQ